MHYRHSRNAASIRTPLRAMAQAAIAIPLLLAACATSEPIAHPTSSTTFYIAAHPDDIELFMGRNAWRDVASGPRRVVFVVLTAGDAGLGMDYTLARESGHERALRFWASLDGKALDATKTTNVTAGGVALDRHAIGERIVAYDLRLPDGNPDGTGYPVTGNESLQILRNAPGTARIDSVDARLHLRYADLQEVIAGILLREAKDSKDVWVNIQDEDAGRNPQDHSDHTATALTVLDVVHQPRFSCVNIARYLDYVTATRRQNMTDAETLIHAGTWGALNSGRVDGLQVTTWDEVHVAWLGREYFAVERSKDSCAF